MALGCSACKELVSNVVEFVFGWGHPQSKAWQTFDRSLCASSVRPAWAKFITPTSRSNRLWDSFHPERDLSCQYTKEDYRMWLAEFFQHMTVRTTDWDHLLFVGFQQQGSDPIPCLELFKQQNVLKTWSAVIQALGDIFLKSTRLGETYRRETMGNASSPFWLRVNKQPMGCSFLSALKTKPIRGRAQWRTAFSILKACAHLRMEKLSFAEWLERQGHFALLKTGTWIEGQSAKHLQWRKQWASSPSTPWEGPDLDGMFSGLGSATFEYALRDLPFDGCLHLFKDDSTNWLFISRSSLAGHSPNRINPEVPKRQYYWQALFHAGVFDRYPPAVVNIALYFMISQEEGMEFYWQNEKGDLEAYQFLPEAMKELMPRQCNVV